MYTFFKYKGGTGKFTRFAVFTLKISGRHQCLELD